MEIAQLAGEFAEISGYATVMFAITLVVSLPPTQCHHLICIGASRPLELPQVMLARSCMSIPRCTGCAPLIAQSTWPAILPLTSLRCCPSQGLAGGFVLLRFESLVEEGKLDNLLKVRVARTAPQRSCSTAIHPLQLRFVHVHVSVC